MKLLLSAIVWMTFCSNSASSYDVGAWIDSQIIDGTQKEFPCPLATDIAPCECDYVSDRLYLDCTNVTSDLQLANVFQQTFPVLEFYELRLEYNEFLQELSMFTNGVSFERMMLYPGPFKITKITEDFLRSSRDRLEDFVLQNSPLTDGNVAAEYFDSLPIFRRLFFEGNQIETVPKFNTTSLRDLRLTISNISSLERNTFESVNYIYNINLQFNKIEVLVSNVFPIFFETVSIHLDFNKIRNIQRRSFYDASLNGTAGLTFLYLNNNDLPGLGIESIPLTKTSRVIDLQNNRISSIASPASFYFLTEPALHSIQILMGNNQIQELKRNIWNPIMEYISVLDLKDNPLTCGCDIAWLVLNTAYMNKLSYETTCEDGRLVHDLDPQVYLELCG